MQHYGAVPRGESEDTVMPAAVHNPASLALARREWVDDVDEKEGAAEGADSVKRSLVPPARGSSKQVRGLTGELATGCTLKRVQLGIMGFLMELVCYADRTNISLAIVEMEKQFGWKSNVDGQILGAFFAGYACTQVYGGWAAERYGGKPVLLYAVILWSMFTLLTPPSAGVSVGLLLLTRVLMGLGEGVSLPTMHHLIAVWIPASERSRFVTLCTSGQFAGTVAAMACSPMVAQSWASIFYLWGVVGFAWAALWWWCGYSTPQSHPTISEDELAFIHRTVEPQPPPQQQHQRASAPPWRRFLCNAPFFACVVAHFCHNWGWYLLLSWLPKYFKDVLGVSTAKTGFMLIAPYTAPFVASNVSGHVSDALTNRGGWSLTAVRKLMQTIAFVGPMSCLAALCWAPQKDLSARAAVALSSGALGFGAFSHSGYWSNVVDLSPRYAGVMIGISNTIATLPGVLANLSTGYILQNTGQDWTLVFMVAITIYAVGLIVFLCYASGEPQSFDVAAAAAVRSIGNGSLNDDDCDDEDAIMD